ncbi:MAG: hypothetical protein AAB601_00365, partial [Patescibacteria group bacterium]
MARKNRVPQVSDEQIAAMAATGVSDTNTDQTVAERSGSDDKVNAATAETAKPKIKTVTPKGADWLNRDPYGLKQAGFYGRKKEFPLRYEDIELNAQFTGTPKGPAELEVMHGQDETAPVDGVDCPICSKPVTSFVQTARVDRKTGDLVRESDGSVQYRGLFVAVGPDPMNLPVHGGHPGECMFRLRLKRDRNGDVIYKTITPINGKPFEVPELLPCHNFAQANARAAA